MENKKGKAPQSSTKRRKPETTNRYAVPGEYLFWKERPVTKEMMARFIEEYIQWSRDPEALVLNEWLVLKKIPSSNWCTMKKKWPELEAAHELVKMTISTRREQLGLQRKLDSQFVYKSMPMYSDEWKEFEEWRSNLAKKNEDLGGTKIVVMERMPSVDEVKPKKE